MNEKLAVVVPVFNEPRVTETLNGLYAQEHTDGVNHFIVDNGSTDDTRARVEQFARDHDDFPLTIVEEDEKGTGAASDTGFIRAIDAGYSTIARTDGDTVPTNNWTSRIIGDFQKNPEMQLLGGRSLPLEDEYYKAGDKLLLPICISGARTALSMRHLNRGYLKAVVGHNLATRSEAYEQAGGFPRSSIDKLDEDVEYSLRIYNKFGWQAIKFDSGMRVSTSMRRIRTYGLIRTSLHHLVPEIRHKVHKGEIDIR